MNNIMWAICTDHGYNIEGPVETTVYNNTRLDVFKAPWTTDFWMCVVRGCCSCGSAISLQEAKQVGIKYLDS